MPYKLTLTTFRIYETLDEIQDDIDEMGLPAKLSVKQALLSKKPKVIFETDDEGVSIETRILIEEEK